MTHRNNLPAKSVNPASLSKRMLIGAVIGLTLIGIFFYGVNDAKPEWGKFWMIRLLLMVPFAGAMGDYSITSWIISAIRVVGERFWQ